MNATSPLRQWTRGIIAVAITIGLGIAGSSLQHFLHLGWWAPAPVIFFIVIVLVPWVAEGKFIWQLRRRERS